MPARASVGVRTRVAGGRASSNLRGRKPRALGERLSEPRCYGRSICGSVVGGGVAGVEMVEVRVDVGSRESARSAYGTANSIADLQRWRGKRSRPSRSARAGRPFRGDGICFGHAAHGTGGARMWRGRGIVSRMIIGAPQCRQRNVGGEARSVAGFGSGAG